MLYIDNNEDIGWLIAKAAKLRMGINITTRLGGFVSVIPKVINENRDKINFSFRDNTGRPIKCSWEKESYNFSNDNILAIVIPDYLLYTEDRRWCMFDDNIGQVLSRFHYPNDIPIEIEKLDSLERQIIINDDRHITGGFGFIENVNIAYTISNAPTILFANWNRDNRDENKDTIKRIYLALTKLQGLSFGFNGFLWDAVTPLPATITSCTPIKENTPIIIDSNNRGISLEDI